MYLFQKDNHAENQTEPDESCVERADEPDERERAGLNCQVESLESLGHSRAGKDRWRS